MSTRKSLPKRKVTIDYSDTHLGLQEFEAEILLHRHDLDGSQLIILRTDQRKSVQEFMTGELIGCENVKYNKMTGIELIAKERQEQIEKHGWTKEHDSGHTSGALRVVAATLAVVGTYARVNDPSERGTGENPWGLEKKLVDDVHRLKVAGALIAAEIDRLQA